MIDELKVQYEKQYSKPLMESGIAEIFTRHLWSWINNNFTPNAPLLGELPHELPVIKESVSSANEEAVAEKLDKIFLDEIDFLDRKIKEAHWDKGMGYNKETIMVSWNDQRDRVQAVRNKMLKALKQQQLLYNGLQLCGICKVLFTKWRFNMREELKKKN